jgi:serine/threonine-protein kinase
VKPPSVHRDDYPEALEAVVKKALEKDPDKRFASAAEMLSALDDAVPSSLEGNAEARVSEYMQKLLGTRGAERRKKIRLAGDLLDLRRDPAHTVITSSTSGSTSAVAFDRSGISQAPGNTTIGPNQTQGSAAVVVERRRLDRFVWLGAIAVAACLGVVAKGALDRRLHDAPRAASSPVPPTPELPATPPVAPASANVAAAAETAAPANSAREDEGETSRGSRTKTRGSARIVTPDGKRGAGVVAAPPPVAAPVASTPTAPSPAAEKNPAPGTSADAWNPQTFGNRY